MDFAEPSNLFSDACLLAHRHNPRTSSAIDIAYAALSGPSETQRRMTNTDHAERRNAPRRRSLKGAQISFRGLRAAIDCTIRDYSETGARLIVESPIGIPEKFDLVQVGARTRFCRVVWRKPTQIGVEFFDTKPIK